MGQRVATLLLGAALVACIPDFPNDDARDLAPDLASDLAPDLAPTPPRLTAMPAEVDFSSQPMGRDVPLRMIEIHNDTGDATGGLTVALDTAAASNATFVIEETTCSAPLPAGDMCTVTVRYRPGSTQQQTATLRVHGPTASDAAVDVALRGSASEACVRGIAGGTTADAATLTDNGTTVTLAADATTTGTFRSYLFDLGAPRTFASIRWRAGSPIGVALPDNHVLEATWPSGNLDMTHNVLLLHLDEVVGATSFVDASGRFHNGSCVNCPTAGAAGTFATALDFGAGVHRVLVPNHAELEPEQMTLEAWVRPSGVASAEIAVIAAKGRDTTQPDRAFALDVVGAGGFRCFVASESGAPYDRASSPPIAPTVFHHVACTYDGVAIRLYVDGNLVSSRARTGKIVYGHTQDAFVIGAWGVNGAAGTEQAFTGQIDEVALYDRALTQTEIEARHLRGAQRLGLRVRSCATSTCDGIAFIGPGAAASASYDERCNPTGIPERTVALDAGCGGSGVGYEPARYWQLEATLTQPPLGHTAALRIDDLALCE